MKHAAFVLAAALGFAGCTTFHSASIAGYEGAAAPLPVAGQGLTLAGVKAARLGALLTRDQTWAVQGSLLRRQSTPPLGPFRLVGLAGVSGYAAVTQVASLGADPQTEADYQNYPGWGLVGHGAVELVVDLGGFHWETGASADVGWDRGPYSEFRHGFAPGGGRFDLSPRDTTLAQQLRVGFSVDLPDQGSAQLLLHSGIVDPDWCGGSSYRGALLVAGITFSGTRGGVTYWGDWSLVDGMNGGLALGVGWQLF